MIDALEDNIRRIYADIRPQLLQKKGRQLVLLAGNLFATCPELSLKHNGKPLSS